MRNTFISALLDLAEIYKDIFLLCGDLGYSVLEPFAKRFPDRFLNTGIAEQNMTQVAAGLAKEGYNVFTYSIGNFPTLRCMEQLRYDVCYHEANVKVVAVGAGYAYGPQGVSHHATEDIAMLRTIPGMKVCTPADPCEARAMAHFVVEYNGPAYIRLNKSGEPFLHDPYSIINLAPGKFLPILKGAGTLVLSTGAITHSLLTEIEHSVRNYSLWSVPFIGEYNDTIMCDIAQKYEQIITVEEHQLNGGFGSSIIEWFSDAYAAGVLKKMPRIKRIGIPNKFIGFSGNQNYLRNIATLTLAQHGF